MVTRRIAAPDRRAKRTRVKVERSLLELLAERGYERTSVRDVAARAAVGKSTFYEHFRDKDAVLKSRLARLARVLGRATVNAEVAFPFLEPLLEHVSGHRPLASRLRERALLEMARVLRHGGRLLAAEPRGRAEIAETLARAGLEVRHESRTFPRWLFGWVLAREAIR